MTLLLGPFPSSCVYVPYATPCCPQARKIKCLYSWGNFKCCYKKNIFCILPSNITMYTTSRLIYPSRKSSVCLSGQLKFHSPKITDISSNSSLLFCLVISYTFLEKKTLIQCNLSRKNKSNHCSPIEMNLKMVLISAGYMFHLPSGMWMLWLSDLGTIRKKAFWYSKKISPNLICFGFMEVFFKLYEIFLMTCNLDKQRPSNIFKLGMLKKKKDT